MEYAMRRAARTDRNHQEIMKLFRQCGWSVKPVHQLKNFCDLLVSKNGVTICVEVKDPAKPPSARKLTKGEDQFRQEWQGRYEIILTEDDIQRIDNELFGM